MYSSVFLFVLPVFYLLGAADPARNIVITVGAIVGRLAGAVFYGAFFRRSTPFSRRCPSNLLFAFTMPAPSGRQDMLIRGALRPPR
jgi:hypothetical protein